MSATKWPEIEIFNEIGHKEGPCYPLGAEFEDQKLVGKVSWNLSHHEKQVSSQNEGIEAHIGRPNGHKMRFLVKSATKEALVTIRLALVTGIKYQKVVGKVSRNLSQH